MSDYSCYVTLVNDTGETLVLQGSQERTGSFEELPQSVGPRSQASIWLKDPPVLPEGSDGSVTYGVAGGCVLEMSFSDPYSGSNSASGSMGGQNTTGLSFAFTGATGSPDNPEPGSVPGGGHPVYLVYTLAPLSAGGGVR